jgi:RNA polymerase sigma-70 factor, ECF subfamily
MLKAEFELCFREHYVMLRKLAYSVVHDVDLANDIVQQVFLNLWQKTGTIVLRNELKPYLQRAVINAALNHLKRNKKITYVDTVPETAATTFNPTDMALRDAAIQAAINKAVNELSPQCRLVFTLSRYQNMTNNDIARHLNVSIKAVEKNMGKALKQLRQKLLPFYKALVTILVLTGRVF